MNYYEWLEGETTCKECGWSGYGREATFGESSSDGAEYHCPKCGCRIVFLPFPTLEEAQSDPRAEAGDRMAAEFVQSRFERFQRSKLWSVSQLPDLNPNPETLTWDVIENSENERYVVILNGTQEVWRELSFYENYDRFGEVAAMLSQKYGKHFRDLIPTRASKEDLYGDRMNASMLVDKVRASLGRGEGVPQ